MANAYIEPVSLTEFRFFYSFYQDHLATRHEFETDPCDPSLTEMTFTGEIPDWRFFQTMIGDVEVCTWNFNPFKKEFYLETAYTRWRRCHLTFEQLYDEYQRIVLYLLNSINIGTESPLSPLKLSIMGELNGVPSATKSALFDQLHTLLKSLSIYQGGNDTELQWSPAVQKLTRRFADLLVANIKHRLSPQDTIHIVLCADIGLYNHVPVLMRSVAENISGPFQFHLLFPDTTLLKETLQRMIQIDPFLRLWNIDPAELAEFQLNGEGYFSHITQTTYARILIPRLLSDVSRVIYLDIDIIVEKDLRSLWELDLEGHPLGMAQEPDDGELRQSQLKSFQAGVILMDLDRLRKVGFEDRIRQRNQKELADRNFVEGQDQGLLCREFENDIQKLPAIYNFSSCVVHFISRPIKLDDDRKIREVIGEDMADKITIYHYAGAPKAWDIPGSRYWKYADNPGAATN